MIGMSNKVVAPATEERRKQFGIINIPLITPP